MTRSDQHAAPPPGRPTLRAALAVALLSAWLVLLFAGWIAGGAVHLLLGAALVLFPWRWALAAGGPESPGVSSARQRPGPPEENGSP